MRAGDELSLCLRVFAPFVRGLEPDPARARQLTQAGHILATEIADELTQAGVPFREAYSQVAALVERAEALGLQVHELSDEDARKDAPELTPGYLRELSCETAVERRASSGGTSRARVLEQLELLSGVAKSAAKGL